MPSAILMAYWVTAGPPFTSITLALMPNESRVLSMILAFSLRSPRSALVPLSPESKETEGYFQILVLLSGVEIIWLSKSFESYLSSFFFFVSSSTFLSSIPLMLIFARCLTSNGC